MHYLIVGIGFGVITTTDCAGMEVVTRESLEEI
jgi:hypothetical protein